MGRLSGGGGDDGHGGGPEIVMLFFFCCLVLGCGCRFLLEELLHTFHIRIPYSVVLLLLGGLWGAAAWKNAHDNDGQATEMATESLLMWASINPKLILFIFLPALIFEGSMGTNYYAFSSGFGGGIMLAGPGMLLQNALIACFAKFGFPYGWGWLESFIFGAILSATDPVAVIALLKELGILPDLRVLIEAESLLNDGTAIVVFDICLMALLEPTTISEYVSTGFQLVLGAPALGLALFIPCYWWLRRTTDPIQDTVVTVCTAYLCYFVAEGTDVRVSGVLSVLTVGVLMAGYGHTCLNTEEAAHMLHAVWAMIVYCAETIIFVLAGAIIMDKGFLADDAEGLPASEYGWMFLNYIVCTFIRAFVVFVFSPVIRQVGYGLQPRVCSMQDFIKNMFVLTWGGLRGAVGLVLALSVSVNQDLEKVTAEGYTRKVLLHCASIVVLTTLVNAATLEKIIGLLGLGQQSEAEKVLFESAKGFLGEKQVKTMDTLQNQLMHPELSNASWSTVKRLVGRHALMGPTGAQGDLPNDHTKEKEKQAAKAAKMSAKGGGEEEGDWELATEEDPTQSGMGSTEEVDIATEEGEGYVLGRYLTSLKASYTAQWNGGLLTSRPYRQIIWALGRAMDHAQDRFPEQDMTVDPQGQLTPVRKGSLIKKGTTSPYAMKRNAVSPFSPAQAAAGEVSNAGSNGVKGSNGAAGAADSAAADGEAAGEGPSSPKRSNKVAPMASVQEDSEEGDVMELPPDAGAADDERGSALKSGEPAGAGGDAFERPKSNRELMCASPELWEEGKEELEVESVERQQETDAEAQARQDKEAAAVASNLVSRAPSDPNAFLGAGSPIQTVNGGAASPRTPGGGKMLAVAREPSRAAVDMKSVWATMAGEDLANRFEWDWLEVEGCFELPRWLEVMRHIPLLNRWFEPIERQYLAERFDLIAAVVRAHEETGRAEVLQHQSVTDFFQLVIEASMYVRDTAEHKLAEMEAEMPEIAVACRTRQACRQVVNSFREEVDALHDIAQITDGEHERLQNRIYSKMMKMNRNYPRIHTHHRALHTLPVFCSIPRLHLESVAESISLEQEVRSRELPITQEGEPSDGVYIITRGVIRWTRSGQMSALENKWATPFSSSVMSNVGGQFDSAGLNSTAVVPTAVQHFGTVQPDFNRGQAASSTESMSRDNGGGSTGTAKNAQRRRRRGSNVELPLTQGSAFHDTEFLLSFAGYPAVNRGSAVTITEVHMYHLTVEKMTILINRFPGILERMWRHSGLLLHASYPDLFGIPPDFTADFTRVKVKRFPKDGFMRVWLPTLIIQGAAKVTGGVLSGEVGPGALGGGIFQLIRREDGETLQFTQEDNRVLVFTPQQDTIIHRRGMEMQSHAKSSRRIISDDEVLNKSKGKVVTKWDQVRSVSRVTTDLSHMIHSHLPPADRSSA